MFNLRRASVDLSSRKKISSGKMYDFSRANTKKRWQNSENSLYFSICFVVTTSSCATKCGLDLIMCVTKISTVSQFLGLQTITFISVLSLFSMFIKQFCSHFIRISCKLTKKSNGHDECCWVGTDVWLKREPFLLVVKVRIVQHRAS